MTTAEETAVTREPALGGGVSVSRYVALVMAGVAILQVVWIAVVPPFRGSDEFDHAYRAAGVAAGQWRATQVPDDGRGHLVVSPEALVRAAHDQCASLDYTGPDNCSPAAELDEGFVLVASGAASYNPAFYWVIGTAAEPFSGSTSLYIMRVTAALMCLFMVGLAAWATAIKPGSGWSRLGLVFALTPVLLYSTVVAAPNGLEMAAALALWSSLLGLDGTVAPHRERALLAIASVALAVLMVDRPIGPMFALCIMLGVWLLQPNMVRMTLERHMKPFLLGSTLVLLSFAGRMAWTMQPPIAGRPSVREGSDWTWSALVLWPSQSIAAFPYRDQMGAVIVYPVVFLIFLALLVVAFRVGRSRDRLTVGLACVAGMAIPIALTAATYEGRGVIWQGRYGLPFTIGIVLLAAAVLDRRGWSTRFRPGLVFSATLLLAVSSAACFLKVLNDELNRPTSRSDASWLMPSDTFVVAVSAVAWVMFYLACRQRDPADV